jgi:uncharacterized protein YecT (DUF1311 family)
MNISRSLLCIFAALASLPSFAESEYKCNSGGLQQEMEACARDDFNRADKELNKAYQALLRKEEDDPLFVSKLRAAQRAWLVFLEADLDAQFACPEEESKLVCWGSMYPMSYLSRKAELTRERTKHLQRLLNEGHGE